MTQRPVLSAISIGEGLTEVFTVAWGESRKGIVAGNFSCGFYVRLGKLFLAFGGPQLPPGPIHVVVEEAPPAPPERSSVHFSRDLIVTATSAFRLSDAEAYRPTRYTRSDFVAMARTLAEADSLDVPPHDLTHIWHDVVEAVISSNLHKARILLQGLGAGLTPSGDDVLAGILLFWHWADPRSEMPAQVAAIADTCDLSRSFLSWAARGQSIKPIHALVECAAGLSSANTPAGSSRADFERLTSVVRSIGSSSGGAMLTGLRLAAVAWLRINSSPLPFPTISQPDLTILEFAR